MQKNILCTKEMQRRFTPEMQHAALKKNTLCQETKTVVSMSSIDNNSMSLLTAAYMFQTRYATQDDVPAIVALVESAYRGESSRHGWTTEADLLDGQRTDDEEVSCLLAQPGNHFLLHEQQSLLASLHLQNQSELAYLGMFAVDPQCQGQGIGAQMLRRAEQIAFEEWGCNQLQMTVIRQREDLIAWYQRHGYRLTGEIRPFPYGNPRFGLPRRDDLQLHVLSKFTTG